MIETYEPFYLLMRIPFYGRMTSEEWTQLRKALPDSFDDVNLNFIDTRVFPKAHEQYQVALDKITPPSIRTLTTGEAILISVALSQSKKRVSKSVREMFSGGLFFWPTKCFDRCLRNYLIYVDQEERKDVLNDIQWRLERIKKDSRIFGAEDDAS